MPNNRPTDEFGRVLDENKSCKNCDGYTSGECKLLHRKYKHQCIDNNYDFWRAIVVPTPNKCPDCGSGAEGKDPLCDNCYKDYLGTHLGSHNETK